MTTKTAKAEKSGELQLTGQQINDFTRLAQFQEAGAAASKESKEIKDAYKRFMIDNQDALASKNGVRAGKLKVWVEIRRELHAEIVE